MGARSYLNAMFISLLFVEVHTESGEIFISSSRADSHPCEYDENKCQHGTCRQTEKLNGRNFLCACPPQRTGTLCENSTNDCLKCKVEARTECTGFSDGTAVCICLEYTDGRIDAPSICYFMKKAMKQRQKACNKGDHKCTRGQECVNYAQKEDKMGMVCQCPVGNTRGADCEQDYQVDIPGKVFSCVETNMYGVICMCKKYGNNNDRYGFCKPKLVQSNLIEPLSDDGPCSLSNNKCRHGNCFQTDENKFLCGCHSKYGGKYCHFERPHCGECVKNKRVECLGLEDGTAVCICLEYSNSDLFKAPSLCYFPEAKTDRQKDCKAIKRTCDPGQQCVDYAHHAKKMFLTCQCPVGRTRGKDCIEDYQFIDMADEQTGCVYSENYGPFCLCFKYGKKRNRPGFCKPNVKVHGAVVKPKGSGGPCEISESRCRHGVCIETESHKDWNFLCSCPLYKTGILCHYDMMECTECKEKWKTDCIGLPDGTAVCICLEVTDIRYGNPPLICYYRKAKSNLQKACNTGKHNCYPGRQCVNYAQTEKEIQMICQCPAGKKHGNRCSEDYKSDIPSGRFSCVDTLLYGPICLCDKYGYGFRRYKFCVPKLKESAGYKLVKNARRTFLKADSPCDAKHNICRGGMCLEVKGEKNTAFVCSCPFMKTGRLCTQDMHECTKCRMSARVDCIGLPDGTAVCICVEFIRKNIADEPAICYFLKYKKHRQLGCHNGDYKCSRGQECVNYAQRENIRQITCQCPAGRKRGKNCNEDYRSIRSTEYPCVDTQKYGPICLCEEYGHGIKKFGFCKPNLKKDDVSQDVSKISKRSISCLPKTCKHGDCDRIGNGYVCSCPLQRTGERCQKISYPCSSCEKTARHDCIGLPDGTARCICTKFIYNNTNDIPTVCYFLKAKPHRQEDCRKGIHKCSPKQECVNYAQAENNMQMTCQCRSGDYRGRNCEEEYRVVAPSGRISCVKIKGQDPICLCQEYGRTPGFCKVQKTKERNIRQATISNAKSTWTTADSTAGVWTMRSSKQPQMNTSLHMLDPGFKDNPCSSNPCLHGGLCKQDLSTVSQDFICICPLQRKGKLCDKEIPDCNSVACKKMTDCISTPEGAMCICSVNYHQQLCSIKMRNVTEWEKVKLVVTARTVQEVEVVAIILLVLLGLAVLYLIWHCIQDSSKSPKKMKDKKKKRDKHGTNENKMENNQNENFPLSKRSSGYGHQTWKNSAQINNSCIKRSLFLPNNMAARAKHNKNQNKMQLRQEYVQEYIKKHQNYFAGTTTSKGKLNGTYSQHVQAAERMPIFTGCRELRKKREFLDDTMIKVPVQTNCYKSKRLRSKSTQR